MPLVLVLDTNAFDSLVADDHTLALVEWACDTGRVRFEVTHVQEDQLAPLFELKPEKAARISRIPRTVVPTAGFLLGYAKLGAAALDDGEIIDVVRGDSGTPATTFDALIASTTERHGRILVTNDGRLAERASKAGVDVWPSDQLVEHLRLLFGDASA